MNMQKSSEYLRGIGEFIEFASTMVVAIGVRFCTQCVNLLLEDANILQKHLLYKGFLHVINIEYIIVREEQVLLIVTKTGVEK